MNLDQAILPILLATPLVGAVVLALLPEREDSRLHHAVALGFTLLTFLFSLHLPFYYRTADHTAGAYQFELSVPWIAQPAIRFHVGVDGLSLWLVVLTGLLAPLGVLSTWNSVRTRTRLFFSLFLLQQVAMIGIFVSLDLFLYYGFWELSLVPLTLLVATFGRTENRRRAALRFFLYAFIPSALLLVALIWLYARTGTFDLPRLAALAASHGISSNGAALTLCSLAFLFAFAVKVPIFPLHGWLAEFLQEAPAAVAMIAAGKLGLYSILRFSLTIFPDQSRRIAPLLIALAAIGIIYGALLALTQNDLKRLAAFSTLSHVNFIALGIFTLTVAGLSGGIFQILNESLIGAALFILLGLLYERYGTYDMRDLGGLAQRHAWMVTFFVITSLAAVGLPMLNGFVGEFLILSGTMLTALGHHVFWTVVATTSVIFSAGYMLLMIQRVFYGDYGLRPQEVRGYDLSPREHTELWPLAVLFLVMGLASPFWMRSIGTYATAIAGTPAVNHVPVTHIESETYSLNGRPATPPEAR